MTLGAKMTDPSESIFIIFFFAMAAIVLIAVICLACKVKKRSGAQTDTKSARKSHTSRRNETSSVAATVDKHILDAVEHGHKGVEEHYPSIVGSLGEINDEGCADLEGVRFIEHDVAYERSDEQRDYTDVVRLMVLGEVLNDPRFKSPYHRK